MEFAVLLILRQHTNACAPAASTLPMLVLPRETGRVTCAFSTRPNFRNAVLRYCAEPLLMLEAYPRIPLQSPKSLGEFLSVEIQASQPTRKQNQDAAKELLAEAQR